MKKILVGMLLLGSIAYAKVEDVLGTWITEKADTGNQIIVEIYQAKNGKYNGRVLELTMPIYTEGEYAGKERMDLQNPDPQLKHRKLVGIDFVSNFDYNEEKDKFEHGNIYSPINGKTYHSYMQLQKDGRLLVKGSIDKAGLIGKKQYWIRYQK